MGILERLGFRPQVKEEPKKEPMSIIVGADKEVGAANIQTFSNENITYSGNLVGFDYTSILKDKQGKIGDLYKLSDYFIDEDPIFKGIIKHVYVPFSLMAKWKLVGVDDKVRNKYLDYYKNIKLTKKMLSICLQFYKFGNVYIYVMPDNNIITLPVNRCKITNVTLNGEPLVEFSTEGLKDGFSGFGSGDQRYFKDNDFKKLIAGYPEEVGKALVKGDAAVQLNPENTFVLQDVKEDWVRYAIPMIASFLPHLAKKALIRQYEDSLLNLGLRSFVHVKYGDPDPDSDFLPDINQLRQVRKLFSQAMSGEPLAVTNRWADSTIVQAKTDFLFEWEKYKEVNNDLLSAGGVSGVIVSGVSNDGSTFSSAQVSMKAATARIEQMLSSLADLMTSINKRVYGTVAGKKNGDAPVFTFMPLDLEGRKALQDAGMALWKAGVLSTRSLMENHGYDIEEELSRREKEDKDGITETLIPRDTVEPANVADNTGVETRGRNTLPDDERSSSPENSQRGKAPKPSNEDGSTENIEGE